MVLKIIIENKYDAERYNGYADYECVKTLSDDDVLNYIGFNPENYRVIERKLLQDAVEEFDDDLVIQQEKLMDETE